MVDFKKTVISTAIGVIAGSTIGIVLDETGFNDKIREEIRNIQDNAGSENVTVVTDEA